MYTKVGDGLQVISGDIVNSLVGLENLTYKMSEEFNSERLWTPSHLSMDNAYKTGYMDSFSHQASIINSYHGEEKGMCSPTGCYHCYSFLQGKSILNKSYVMTSKCTRIEEECTDLERMFNFTISEIVFVGTEKYCEDNLNKAMHLTSQLLEHLGIDYFYEVASDPFFGDKSELKRKVQIKSGSKIEIRAWIPNEDRHVAIGSFNLHGRKFIDKFNIHESEMTACFGWGLERFVDVLSKYNKKVDFDSINFNYSNDDKFKTELRKSIIDDSNGWLCDDHQTYWFGRKPIHKYEIQTPDIGDVVYEDIDTIEKLDKWTWEILQGLKEWDRINMEWITEETRKTWLWDLETAKKRIQDGHNLCAMFHDDKLIQWNWWFMGEFTFYDHDWNIDMNLPKDHSYGGYWACLPKYRTSRKHGKLIEHFYTYITNYLIGKNIKYDLAYVDGWNNKAISIHKKMGYVGYNWMGNENFLK